jgi:hypothetical protein
MSAAALGVLLMLLMAFDGRVREQVGLRLSGPAKASSDIAAVGAEAQDLVHVLYTSVKVQSQQHGPLMIMVVAGTALTLIMFRT